MWGVTPQEKTILKEEEKVKKRRGAWGVSPQSKVKGGIAARGGNPPKKLKSF